MVFQRNFYLSPQKYRNLLFTKVGNDERVVHHVTKTLRRKRSKLIGSIIDRKLRLVPTSAIPLNTKKLNFRIFLESHKNGTSTYTIGHSSFFVRRGYLVLGIIKGFEIPWVIVEDVYLRYTYVFNHLHTRTCIILIYIYSYTRCFIYVLQPSSSFPHGHQT